MFSQRVLLRGGVCCAIITVCACDFLDSPSGPEAVDLSQAALFDQGPFYYFRPSANANDARIMLDLDPTEIIVASRSRDDAIAAFVDAGVTVASTENISYAAADHRRVRLPTGTSTATVEAAVTTLREDSRISFAAHAYRAANGAKVALVNRLVVRFRDNIERAQIDAFIDSLGARVLRAAEPDSGRATWWLAYPAERDPLEVAAQVHNHPLVRWADPDRLVDRRMSSHIPSDSFYVNQYYLKNALTLNNVPVDVNVEPAWLAGVTGSEITVAIIGSGIDGSHPEVEDRRKSGVCQAGWDSAFVEPDFTGSAWTAWAQDCTHGTCTTKEYIDHETAVAGIIAAEHDGEGTVGIAPDVWLVSARIGLPGVFGLDATNAQVVDAINWAWHHCDADVISNSWGQPTPSTMIAIEIDSAAVAGRDGLGTLFVVSGGNSSARDSGVLAGNAFPASLEITLAVGAIDRWGGVANYSPYDVVPSCPGGWECISPLYYGKFGPDLVAPSGHFLYGDSQCTAYPADSAADVYTTDIAGQGSCDGDYMPGFSGTSATAPQAAAAAALLLSDNRDLTLAQLKGLLLDSADAWGAAAEFGAGKLNIGRALGITIPPITSLTIGGAAQVKPNDTCMWWASVSGGTAPFTYNWYRNGAWVASGSWVTLETGTASFTLGLEVEDSYEQTENTSRSITVTGSAQYCFQ